MYTEGQICGNEVGDGHSLGKRGCVSSCLRQLSLCSLYENRKHSCDAPGYSGIIYICNAMSAVHRDFIT